ncbi:hypothetical protein EV644_10630 [Kribbella orskensis]|uniref:Uncharacterized protein n=1 Tax=Kribbella orskensis TaxID=2512216 RepID=A0ABY2BJI7_9ACTN|nr:MULTISPECIES: hypothetical protein [Kribbella]TCN40103.1 hypothetical protein EV642_10530 [Kribbella sp. VKM Ac-2500]TCO22723.1 hypothetical protein EV644_10630 [Kribbella orskensis]
MEYTLSVDRAVDSLTLAIVRDFDEAADSSIIRLTEATAPGPIGTLSSVLQLPAMPAGGARRVVLWTSDMDRAAKATVRFRSEAQHDERTRTDLVNDVVIPDLIPFKA